MSRAFFIKMILLLPLTFLVGCFAPDVTKTENKSTVVAQMTETLKQQHPDFQALSVDELKKLMKEKDYLLVDVRTSEEREVSTLPFALSKEQWTEKSAEAKKKSQLWIIAYDTLGYRSVEFLKELKTQGYQNTAYLSGGVLAWAHAGELFFHQEKSTRRVHVSSKAWNLLPESYEAIHD